MPLTEGGLQYLMAAARGNVGIKSGRYVYEVKVIETLNPSEGLQRSARTPMPRQLLKLGFSTLEAPLLGETDETVSFDSEGFFYCGKQRVQMAQRLCKDQIIAVLLNLDQSGGLRHGGSGGTWPWSLWAPRLFTPRRSCNVTLQLYNFDGCGFHRLGLCTVVVRAAATCEPSKVSSESRTGGAARVGECTK
eukprot:symbB.v1.2.004332.t1/scaffold188.1/size279614/21